MMKKIEDFLADISRKAGNRDCAAQIDAQMRRFQKESASMPPRVDGLAPYVPLGYYSVNVSNTYKCYARVPLPFGRGLYAEQTEESVQTVLWLLRDIMHFSGAGAVQITVVDTYEMGRRFKALFTDPPVLAGGVIHTDVQKSADVINDFAASIGTVRRDILGSRFESWDEYRRANPGQGVPYRVLLIANAQELLSDAASSLRRSVSAIVREGPQTGILPILLFAESSLPDRFREWRDELIHQGGAHDLMSPPPFILDWRAKFPNLKISWSPSYPPETGRTPASLVKAWQKEARDKASAVDCSLKHLLNECSRQSSLEGVSVPMGWDEATGAPAMFMLDDGHPHAFIGGQTGMGKSNVMHVLLNAWMACYSEEELQIYILDFKEGVEMGKYAFHALPHIKLVARKSDQDFAVSILEHLRRLAEERAGIFRTAGVSNLESYRKKTGEPMSRIVLLVDECQNLFNRDSMRDSADISEKATWLVQKGRSYGIHLVLSCQSLSGMKWNSPQLWNNIRVRVALKCMERESCSILASNNPAAARITERKQAVLNLSNGEPEYNIIVNVPLADITSPELQNHLKHLEKPGCSVREYQGAEPLPLPDAGGYAAQCAANAVWLGATATFQAEQVCLPLYDEREKYGVALLACMGSADARDGLCATAMLSAQHSPDVAAIYYVADQEPPEAVSSLQKFHFLQAGLLTVEQWREILDGAEPGHRKVVYIESLDRLQSLLKFPNSFSSSKGADTLGSVLAEALANVDRSFVSIIADMRHVPDSTLMRDLRSHFSSFLVQGVNEGDASRFIGSMELHLPIGTDEISRCKAMLSTRAGSLVYRPFMQVDRPKDAPTA